MLVDVGHGAVRELVLIARTLHIVQEDVVGAFGPACVHQMFSAPVAPATWMVMAHSICDV